MNLLIDELPVNAERIESHLAQIWQETVQQAKSDRPLSKLCLANLVLVCDADSRDQADQLANDLARRQPARLIMLIIDDRDERYAATVRTACAFNPDTDSVVCWEVIELYAPTSRADHLPGAVRSLLVDSVPVLLVDLRGFQSTPQMDRQLLGMASFAFTQAELIPSHQTPAPILPLNWFRTLGLRDTCATVLAVRRRRSESANLTSCLVPCSDQTSPCALLLYGWLMARFRQHELSVDCLLDETSGREGLLLLTFADSTVVRIDGDWLTTDPAARLSAHWPDVTIARPFLPMPLSQYLFLAASNQTEIADYAAAWRALASRS